MKKLVICGLIAASFGITASQAATVGQDFNVTATVAAKCVANNGAGTPALDFGQYTAFGAAATPSPTLTLNFNCTRGLAPSGVALSAPDGAVAGLYYTISVGSGTKSGGAAATGVLGAQADGWAYTVTGNMASGQAGDVTGGTPTSQTRTLTVTF